MSSDCKRTLLIIEAPAKEKALAIILQRLQLDYHITSTSGHLIGFEKSLWPMSISRNLKPTALRVLKPNAYLRIKNAINEHEHIIIATDPDSEGHYIANDVADLCSTKHQISRAYFYSMDKEHVLNGLNHLCRHEPSLAYEASRRKVVDRIICSTLSDRESGIFVGRVMTPSLHRVSTSKQTPIPIKANTPFNGIELVYHGSSQLGITPSKTAIALQSIYQRGKIAYHRSDSHRVTSAAAREVGMAYGRTLPINDHIDSGAHPAPYPIKPSVDINMPLDQYSIEDAIITIASRQWTNTPHEKAEFVLAHHFIEAMTDMDLGRPSTVPFTADRLADSGLIMPDGQPSSKGSIWIEQGAPLLGEDVIQKLNNWIANGGDLEACFKSMGIDGIVREGMDEKDNDHDLGLGCNHTFD